MFDQFTTNLINHRTEQVGDLTVLHPVRVEHGGWASTVKFTDAEGRTTSFNMPDPDVSKQVANAAHWNIASVFNALRILADGQSHTEGRMRAATAIVTSASRAA